MVSRSLRYIREGLKALSNSQGSFRLWSFIMASPQKIQHPQFLRGSAGAPPCCPSMAICVHQRPWAQRVFWLTVIPPSQISVFDTTISGVASLSFFSPLPSWVYGHRSAPPGPALAGGLTPRWPAPFPGRENAEGEREESSLRSKKIDYQLTAGEEQRERGDRARIYMIFI